MDNQQLHQLVMDVLDEFKAIDPVSLDVRELTSITDNMVICTGRSTRHVKSIAENLVVKVKQSNVLPLSVTGKDRGEWVLVDLADIVVHVMLPEMRDFYQLERLWSTKSEFSTNDANNA